MPTDILLDDNFDLVISDGDLVVGESTRQHQKLLLMTEKGELRDTPTRGVGIAHWIADDAPANITIETKRQFQLDGMKVSFARLVGGKLETDARYD